MDRLIELNTFLAVMDEGSFARAARRIGRSAPGVTRIIGELEHRIGVRLFDRNSRRCTPTEAARQFAANARDIVCDYEHAVSGIRGEAVEAKGRLRITAPYFFGREHVAPLILEFLEEQPGISCELDLSDRPIDLLGERVDLAVRIGPISDLSLKARRAGVVRTLIVTSPEYLERSGTPTGLDDMKNHQLIQHGSQGDAPWRLVDGMGNPIDVSVHARFTVNQADAALAAARAGHGLVTALSYQVDADLRSGRLVSVLDRFAPSPVPVHLAWPDGRERLLRARLLIDYLATRLSALPILGGVAAKRDASGRFPVSILV